MKWRKQMMKNQTKTNQSPIESVKSVPEKKKKIGSKKSSGFTVCNSPDIQTEYDEKTLARMVFGVPGPLPTKGLSKKNTKKLERLISIYNREVALSADLRIQAYTIFSGAIGEIINVTATMPTDSDTFLDLIESSSRKIAELIELSNEKSRMMMCDNHEIFQLLKKTKGKRVTKSPLPLYWETGNPTLDRFLKSVNPYMSVKNGLEDVVEMIQGIKAMGNDTSENAEEPDTTKKESGPMLSLSDLRKKYIHGYPTNHKYIYATGYLDLCPEALDALESAVAKTCMLILGRAELISTSGEPMCPVEYSIVSSLKSNGIMNLPDFIQRSKTAVRNGLESGDPDIRKVLIRAYSSLSNVRVLSQSSREYCSLFFSVKMLVWSLVSKEFPMVDSVLLRKAFTSMNFTGKYLNKRGLNQSLMVDESSIVGQGICFCE